MKTVYKSVIPINIIPLIVLFLTINGLFILKYVARTPFPPILLLTVYLFTALSIIILFFRFAHSLKIKQTNYFIGLVSLVVVAGIFTLYIYINPYDLMIDRWSAIHNFNQNLFSGEYPYSAKTHLGGYASPFPVWQYFHIPFYLIGNIAFAMIFSFLLLLFALIRLTENKESVLFYVLLLAISPSFWYEASVRSDLFYNFLLVLIVILFIQNRKYSINNNSILLGTICGLFLSTRISVVITFFLYFLSDFFASQLKNKVKFIFIIAIVFFISFLPLMFWNFNTLFFFEYNPFVLQTRQGSVFEFILVGAFGAFLALNWKKDFIKFNAFTSYTIIALVVVTFIHRSINSNFVYGLFNPSFDITYFNMALPFLIYSISHNIPVISEKKQFI